MYESTQQFKTLHIQCNGIFNEQLRDPNCFLIREFRLLLNRLRILTTSRSEV